MQHKRDNNRNSVSSDDILVGLFSKKEAAHRIADGCRHIHSSVMGAKDAGYVLTRSMTRNGGNLPYSWEPRTGISEVRVEASGARQSAISRIVSETRIETKRQLKEKVSSVLEELITNAIYHAYRNAAGTEKYARSKSASLAPQESVTVGYQANENGIYLSVADQGGTLSFRDVAASFQRCYSPGPQIQTKESGAGLGIYMIFEHVSHLKIVSCPGRSCQVVCWLADKKSYDPDNFSFNFFESPKGR